MPDRYFLPPASFPPASLPTEGLTLKNILKKKKFCRNFSPPRASLSLPPIRREIPRVLFRQDLGPNAKRQGKRMTITMADHAN